MSKLRVSFLRKHDSTKFSAYFTYPNILDEAVINANQIVKILQLTHERRGRHYFKLDSIENELPLLE